MWCGSLSVRKFNVSLELWEDEILFGSSKEWQACIRYDSGIGEWCYEIEIFPYKINITRKFLWWFSWKVKYVFVSGELSHVIKNIVNIVNLDSFTTVRSEVKIHYNIF